MKSLSLAHLVVGIGLALSLALSVGMPAFAAEPQSAAYGRAIPVQSTTVQYIKARVNLNIRSGPGMGYAVLEHFLAGNTVPVTGLSLDGRWWRVPCPPHGAIGDCFVSANWRYSRPVAPDDPNEAIGVVNTNVTAIQALVNVNVRRGPAYGYARITVLPAGTVIAVTGVSLDGHWWRVSCPPGGINGNCFVSDNNPWTQPVN
jgi:uncharacterized protein YraI